MSFFSELLSMFRYRELVQSVVQIFEQSQQAFSSFQRSTGMHCLSGCGSCCLNHEVSASIIEMLPAAWDIVESNRTEDVLNALTIQPEGQCLFYQRDSEDGHQGHCGNYQFRAMVCRSFGVAAVKNKRGEKTLSVCKLIKAHYPNLYERTNAEPAPIIGEFAQQVLGLDPHLAQIYPINTALENAILLLERERYYQTMTQSS